MPKCNLCGREIKAGVSCDGYLKHKSGILYTRHTYEDKSGDHCFDCNTPPGGYHHFGCDIEPCPVCGDSQVIFCGCFSK